MGCSPELASRVHICHTSGPRLPKPYNVWWSLPETNNMAHESHGKKILYIQPSRPLIKVLYDPYITHCMEFSLMCSSNLRVKDSMNWAPGCGSMLLNGQVAKVLTPSYGLACVQNQLQGTRAHSAPKFPARSGLTLGLPFGLEKWCLSRTAQLKQDATQDAEKMRPGTPEAFCGCHGPLTPLRRKSTLQAVIQSFSTLQTPMLVFLGYNLT